MSSKIKALHQQAQKALQVRSPINNRSVGNWKKYDAYLDSVKEVLASRIPT